MDETDYARQRRLWRENRQTAQAIYGEWRHPDNIAWARSRDIAGADSLRSYCSRLESRLQSLEFQNRQRAADSAPSPYLEDIRLPGHRHRPDMAMSDRLWLVDPFNRGAVANLWACILTARRCALGTYGFLTSDQLDDAGIRETLIAHWRTIDYTDAGERIETIPGSMIAHDLELLGLGLADIENGTVVTPQRRPAPVRRHPAAEPVKAASSPHKGDNASQAVAAPEPVLIRRRSKGVPRGA